MLVQLNRAEWFTTHWVISFDVTLDWSLQHNRFLCLKSEQVKKFSSLKRDQNVVAGTC